MDLSTRSKSEYTPEIATRGGEDGSMSRNASLTGKQSNHHFPFLKLPVELRSMIYNHTLEDPRFCLGALTDRLYNSTSFSSRAKIQPTCCRPIDRRLNLLLTGHQVATEFASVVYSASKFDISDDTLLKRFTSAVPKKYLSLITDLHLDIRADGNFYRPPDLSTWKTLVEEEVVGKMIGLRNLKIEVSPWNGSCIKTTCKKLKKTSVLPHLNDGTILLHVHQELGDYISVQNSGALQFVKDIYKILMDEGEDQDE